MENHLRIPTMECIKTFRTNFCKIKNQRKQQNQKNQQSQRCYLHLLCRFFAGDQQNKEKILRTWKPSCPKWCSTWIEEEVNTEKANGRYWWGRNKHSLMEAMKNLRGAEKKHYNRVVFFQSWPFPCTTNFIIQQHIALSGDIYFTPPCRPTKFVQCT